MLLLEGTEEQEGMIANPKGAGQAGSTATNSAEECRCGAVWTGVPPFVSPHSGADGGNGGVWLCKYLQTIIIKIKNNTKIPARGIFGNKYNNANQPRATEKIYFRVRACFTF